MKFIKIMFYDNDFASCFLEAGKRVREQFLGHEKIVECDDMFLSELKNIIISIAYSEIKLRNLYWLEYTLHSYNEDRVNKRESDDYIDNGIKEAIDGYKNEDFHDYLSKVNLSIVDIDIKNVGWNNSETVYIPFEEPYYYIEPFIS